MTCIAATIHNGFVYMGADSCASDGNFQHNVLNPKVFRVDDFIIGCTSSFRMIDLLAYSLELPKVHPDDNIEKWMRTKFIDAVRDCLEDGGFMSKDDNVEKGGEFLVGYKDNLYQVQCDFSVLTCPAWGMSVGSGFEVAMGSLFTSHQFEPEPFGRVLIALDAASAIITSVRGPHAFLTTNPDIPKLLSEEEVKTMLAPSKRKR